MKLFSAESIKKQELSFIKNQSISNYDLTQKAALFFSNYIFIPC